MSTAADDGPVALTTLAAPALAPWSFRRSALPDSGDSNGLLLGLYLLLLAFFVMLTALSQREESRIRAVLASLHGAFAAHMPRPEALPFDLGMVSTLAGAELEHLERLFAADLPLHAASVERVGDRLRLRLRTEVLFAPGSTAPRRSRRILFARLADFLASPPMGLHAEAIITVGIPDIASTTSAAARLAVERAGALARVLADLDAPASRLTVGVGEGAPDEVLAALVVRPAPAPSGRR